MFFFLFRSTSPGVEIVDNKFSYFAADSPFKAYLDESCLTSGGTLQGFSSGWATTPRPYRQGLADYHGTRWLAPPVYSYRLLLHAVV